MVTHRKGPNANGRQVQKLKASSGKIKLKSIIQNPKMQSTNAGNKKLTAEGRQRESKKKKLKRTNQDDTQGTQAGWKRAPDRKHNKTDKLGEERGRDTDFNKEGVIN